MPLRQRGPIEGAAGVEVRQQTRGRVAFHLAMSGLPITQTRQGRPVTAADADLPSPQRFTPHPRIRVEPGDDVPVNEFTVHLPGRVPPAGWDGEPGASSPTAGWL